MPKIYKPNKATMSPNNETITSNASNIFSFVFTGDVLTSFYLNIYDIASGTRLNFTDLLYNVPNYKNGTTVSFTLSSSFWTSMLSINGENRNLSWSVDVFGESFGYTGNPGSKYIDMVTSVNFGIAERVKITSVSTGGYKYIYLTPSVTNNRYYMYETIEAARNNLNADRITVDSEYSVGNLIPTSTSERAVFLTSQFPTFYLAPVTITSAKQTISPVYSHPNSYLIENYKVYFYDGLNNLIEETDYIYSSNPIYSANYLIDGNSYKIRFTATNIVGQFVDTGIVNIVVSYPSSISALSLSITAENDCKNGRIKVNIPSGISGTVMIDPNINLIVQSIIIYRQEYNKTKVEAIANIPLGQLHYSDYYAKSTIKYSYFIGLYGYAQVISEPNESPFPADDYYVIIGSTPTAYLESSYYGWFLIDLDSDKSYMFDVQFDGGEFNQEDDFTKYKTNKKYGAYSVGNTKSYSGSQTALVSVSNLGIDFVSTNDILKEISNVVSPSNTNRKIIKDRRVPTRIFSVFTHGFKQYPMNNSIGLQPYLCSFNWEQISEEV